MFYSSQYSDELSPFIVKLEAEAWRRGHQSQAVALWSSHLPLSLLYFSHTSSCLTLGMIRIN